MAMIARVSIWSMLCAAVVLVGCDDSSTTSPSESDTYVKVVYDGKPLANVQVLLKQTADGAPLARAITNERGFAYVSELPSPEPQDYIVAMESISDGGWMLNPSVMKKLGDSLHLKPFSESPHQTIELPRRAVQSLVSNH